jgi:dihydroflavonol-4-reductase
MKTLVIGGTGLLGITLVQELLNRNKEVKVTVRDNSPPEAVSILKHLGVEIAYADMRDKERIDKALDRVEDVYLAAALFETWLSDPEEFTRVNIKGAENVLDLCLKKGIRRVVYTGSHGTIGLSEYPAFADENTPVSEQEVLISPYLRSKYYAEKALLGYLNLGLDIVTVNPVGMIGINDFSNNPTNKYIRSAAAGRLPGFYVNAYTCLVDSRDAACGHILAMEKGRSGQRYILGGDNITFKEYFMYLAELAGKEIKPIELSLTLLLFCSYFVEWEAALFSKEPVLTSGSVKFLMKRSRYSSKKSQEELGYHFRPIKEAIKEVYQWFNEKRA